MKQQLYLVVLLDTYLLHSFCNCNNKENKFYDCNFYLRLKTIIKRTESGQQLLCKIPSDFHTRAFLKVAQEFFTVVISYFPMRNSKWKVSTRKYTKTRTNGYLPKSCCPWTDTQKLSHTFPQNSLKFTFKLGFNYYLRHFQSLIRWLGTLLQRTSSEI